MDFVLASIPRSGTQMVCGNMYKQTKVFPWGEIFSENYFSKWQNIDNVRESSLIKEFESTINNKIPKEKKDITNFIIDNGAEFLNTLSKYTSFDNLNTNNKLIGFKLMDQHLLDIKKRNKLNVFLNYFKVKQTKIIVLERKNYFLTYLSNRMGFAGNGFKLSKEEKINRNNNSNYKVKKINFNVDNYLASLNFKKNYIVFFNEFLTKSELPFLKIYYEDFITDESFFSYKKMYNFLGIDDVDIRDIKNEDLYVQKQNVYTLDEQIENIKEVREKLKDDINFLTADTPQQ